MSRLKIIVGIVFAAVAVLLVTPMSLAATGGLQVTMSPTLFPAFDPSITDYVFTYQAGVTQTVSVNAPKNTVVSIDGQPFAKLVFSRTVNLTPGQSFVFVVNSVAGSSTYHVRCLPTDFPTWTTTRNGTPQAQYYVFGPDLSASGAPSRHYVVFADGHGVPIWWYVTTGIPDDAKLLPDGTVGWIDAGQFTEVRRLNGTLVSSLVPNASIGGTIDQHELLLLPNGNYLFIVAPFRGPVDLTAFGGKSNATVTDNVIEEIAPDGSLVFSWSTFNHLAISTETDPEWYSQFLTASVVDPFHMNSVESNSNSSRFVISFRHLNAVLLLDAASGNIVWKLGGTADGKNLTFIGDPYGNFGGQHDARVLPDGTLTLHDDGTGRGRGPRAVRYSLDTGGGTATLLEQVTDAAVTSSPFVGSARKLSGGDWVTAWGGSPFVTELKPDGTVVLRLTIQGPYTTYRAAPVEFGVVSLDQLRGGMDAQFPR